MYLLDSFLVKFRWRQGVSQIQRQINYNDVLTRTYNLLFIAMYTKTIFIHNFNLLTVQLLHGKSYTMHTHISVP